MPKISIIVPVTREEDYLKLIESIPKSTSIKYSDYEINLVTGIKTTLGKDCITNYLHTLIRRNLGVKRLNYLEHRSEVFL